MAAAAVITVKKARWTSTASVKRLYSTASVVSAERIVFNLEGNDYRLVVAVDFEKAIVWIKWIGSHADYEFQNDALIVMTARRHGATVVTNDRLDFELLAERTGVEIFTV